MLSLSRHLDRIGVLARAGSVIPLAGNLTEAAGDNPRELEIVVVPGGSGSFTLEEDDGSAQPGPDRIARTHMALTWPEAEDEDGADVVLRIRLEGGGRGRTGLATGDGAASGRPGGRRLAGSG